VPADEKQIVASLRTLQRDLNEAIQTINSLTRERDEALLELKFLRAANKKHNTPKKVTRVSSRVDEELFDLSRSIESPKKSPARRALSKTVGSDARQNAKTTISDDARVLTPIPVDNPVMEKQRTNKPSYKKPAVNDTENSMMEDPTAASNTSRRRRHLDQDENMTSAYILPDITVDQPVNKEAVSTVAQSVLHRHDPEHVHNCDVCQRLTSKKTKRVSHATHDMQISEKKDFTAQITQLMKDAMLEEPTMRPKISPWQALANVKTLLTDQFNEAKRKHSRAWQTYDSIEAPLSSKKHAAASQELFYWSKKMEECRINLDQLRDVEEGMKDEDDF
jgi:hypothetical protein